MFDINFRRKKQSQAVTGGNDAIDTSYNRPAGGLKVINLHGMLTPLGDASTAKDTGDKGSLVALFNPSSTAVVYAKFGDVSTVSAPTNGANGVAIPPLQYVSLACGLGSWVITSGLCYAYLIEDDTYLTKQNG